MKKEKIIKEVISYVVIIGVVLLIKLFIFTPIKVNGDSMHPTLHNNDIMILNEIGYHLDGLKRFEIVVVDYHGEKLIKRVVGLPGDKIEFKDDKLYVNDEIMEEEFQRGITEDFSLNSLGYEIIPDDYYLVLGDNRDDSIDSRVIGLINKKDIMGKTSLIVFPFNRFGKVK